jgi:hypothetical protein
VVQLKVICRHGSKEKSVLVLQEKFIDRFAVFEDSKRDLRPHFGIILQPLVNYPLTPISFYYLLSYPHQYLSQNIASLIINHSPITLILTSLLKAVNQFARMGGCQLGSQLLRPLEFVSD